MATDDGSLGLKGFVTELVDEYLGSDPIDPGFRLYACGPTPMLRAVAGMAQAYGLPCQISLEEHMACAVGGCAGCNVEVQTPEGPAMKRICVDGPVFEASSIFPAAG